MIVIRQSCMHKSSNIRYNGIMNFKISDQIMAKELITVLKVN